MGQKINFIVSPEIASGATGGIVLGDFNNWNEKEALPLKKNKDGSLKATVVLDSGKSYQYRYLLNDGRWVNDVNATSYHYDPVFNVENCVVEVKEKKKKTDKAESKLSAEKISKNSSKKVTSRKETVADAKNTDAKGKRKSNTKK